MVIRLFRQVILFDVTARFNAVIKYTRDYFQVARVFFGDNVIDWGDWNILKDAFFANKVRKYGQFDLKNSTDPFLGFSEQRIGKIAIYNGVPWQFQDFGNFNFGVAAKAFGLSLEFALRGAGIAQILSGHRVEWSNLRGFGDPYRDSQMIELGYNRF